MDDGAHTSRPTEEFVSNHGQKADLC
eukprot:COSAG01_NODE_64371_length_276_cov_4.644068_1_plen_25_part_10